MPSNITLHLTARCPDSLRGESGLASNCRPLHLTRSRVTLRTVMVLHPALYGPRSNTQLGCDQGRRLTSEPTLHGQLTDQVGRPGPTTA